MTAEDVTINALTNLIEVCKEGEHGFRLSAEQLGSTDMADIFIGCAEQCRLSAVELRALVQQLGAPAETGGTAASALMRGWAALKGALLGCTDDQILDAMQHAEDRALARYREVLERNLTPIARAVVQNQLAEVQHHSDLVQALRLRTRMAAA